MLPPTTIRTSSPEEPRFYSTKPRNSLDHTTTRALVPCTQVPHTRITVPLPPMATTWQRTSSIRGTLLPVLKHKSKATVSMIFFETLNPKPDNHTRLSGLSRRTDLKPSRIADGSSGSLFSSRRCKQLDIHSVSRMRL